MSVINRIEIANFLNLDNIEPRKSQWQTHYPHLLLNLRGQSAAIVATNGMGKSTINRAIYCMLTRDQGFAQNTKAVCAPQRSGIYTHIRVELLYRDQPIGGLLGQMGAEVPGEPYVFGIYGNADSELTFYYYEGNLEDCRCVERTGIKVRIVPNQRFRDQLRAQRDAHPNLTKEGSLELVAKHFDPAMLAQLVAYQKAGGGDSAEEFFRVKTRRSDGQTDFYDAAFFYEHIAPEVLANAMRGFGKEDETRFEDTILNSASPLIRAELKNERHGTLLERDQRTFREIEKVREKLKEFVEARSRLDRLVADLGGEVSFLLDAVEQRPLPGVPRVLTERSEQIRRVANGLVKQAGEWLAPDALLGEMTASEAREINQDADRHEIISRVLSRRDVIEIPCDNFFGRSRGAAGRGYTLPGAIALIQRRATFAPGWDKESALRALNYGFEYRLSEGETNPFRSRVVSLEAEQKSHTEKIVLLDGQSDEFRRQQVELVGRIQSLQADAYELKMVRESGVFSPAELDNLEAVAPTVAKAAVEARRVREMHEQRRIELNDGRAAYTSFADTYGVDDLPLQALDRLETERQQKATALAAADQTHKAAKGAERDARAAVAVARTAAEEKGKERQRLEVLLEPVERFEEHFLGENPVGLAPVVRQQRDEAVREKISLESRFTRLNEEQTKLRGLAAEDERFQTIFHDENPVGLEIKVRERFAYLERRLTELPSELARQTKLIEALKIGQTSLRYAEGIAADRAVIGLETLLREEHKAASANTRDTAAKLASADADAAVIERFRRIFPGASSPVDQRQKRAERLIQVIGDLETQQKRAELLSRQLEELRKSATAAGRIASEVIEVVGGTPRRVHQVIEEELTGSDHRPTVLMHFSHVLHAPVAKTAEEARRMLDALDEAEIESPVFWLDGLREYCSRADVNLRGDLALGMLAGGATLQVKGLIDPHQVERTRAEIAAALAKALDAVEALTAERANLEEASEASQLVREAFAADERGLVMRLNVIRGEAAGAMEAEARLAALLSEDSVQRLRAAERYLQDGGDGSLAAGQTRLSGLGTEKALLEAERPAAAARASDESIALIQRAVSFRAAGGANRLADVRKGLAEAEAAMAKVEADLPRLQERADRISDIQAAEQFAKAGGRGTLAAMIEDIAKLAKALKDAEAAHDLTLAVVEKAEKGLATSTAELAEADIALATQGPMLHRAQGYVDADGPTFDRDYAILLGELKREEDRCDRRASFRLGMAVSALAAERGGRSVTSLQQQHGRLEQEILAARERKAELERLIAGIVPKLDAARLHMARLDAVVHTLLDRRQQARLAASAVEMSQVSAVSLPTGPLVKAIASAERVRQGFGDELDEHILDELEELVIDTEEFQLGALKPRIQEARTAKDRSWSAYTRAVDSLRDDKALTLSPTDRTLLDEALAIDRTNRIEQLFGAFEKHVLNQERVWFQAKEDIENERQKLSESLEAFTFQVEDHFKLLKLCLKPSADGSDAGFEIEAEVLGRDGVRKAVDDVIAMIKRREKARAEEVDAGQTVNQADFEKGIREEIRRSFYRAVFAGLEDPKTKIRGGPRVYLRHPRIGRGDRMQLTKKISTGQANALALLLMTKMADFAIHRDERDSLASAGRRRGSTHQTRVVMIDGLFSNVSNRKLIRESLDALRTLKGKFQLIGWIHNEAYENDPEIFPEHIGLRRIGNGEGFVVVDDQVLSDNDEELGLGEGTIEVVELHVDKLPEHRPHV